MKRRIITVIAAVAIAVSGMAAIGLSSALTATPAGAALGPCDFGPGPNTPYEYPVDPFNFFGGAATYTGCTPAPGLLSITGVGLQLWAYPGQWYDEWNTTTTDTSGGRQRLWAALMPPTGVPSGCYWARGKATEHVYAGGGWPPGDYLVYSHDISAVCI